MPITLTCPSCGQQCAVKEEYAGMQVRCPRCPGVITVPAIAPAPATAVAEQPTPDLRPHASLRTFVLLALFAAAASALFMRCEAEEEARSNSLIHQP